MEKIQWKFHVIQRTVRVISQFRASYLVNICIFLSNIIRLYKCDVPF